MVDRDSSGPSLQFVGARFSNFEFSRSRPPAVPKIVLFYVYLLRYFGVALTTDGDYDSMGPSRQLFEFLPQLAVT